MSREAESQLGLTACRYTPAPLATPDTFSSGRVLEMVREIEFSGRDAMDFEAIRERFAELENALDELRLDLENLIPTL